MISAVDALGRLQEGNGRFVAGINHSNAYDAEATRCELLAGQKPFAVILGCSDSRVPVEMVFDQGLGDLFVIRIAGNIVSPSQIGSVEFAVEKFGTPLVVVMGHTMCGAVEETIQAIIRPAGENSPNLQSIVSRIRPAVEPLLATELRNDPAALLKKATRANVRIAADRLRNGSEILEDHVRKDGLLIVGAEYSLETGAVDFFDGVPG